MHKNEPKQESNQATLARVKKEMVSRAWPNPREEEGFTQTMRPDLEKRP
jgi:hypothetical protein